MSIFVRRRAISHAEQVVLAAMAKARVELLISEMDQSLRELREIIIEGKDPSDRLDQRPG